MNRLWHEVTRSTGIVAAILMVAALAWGFFFSARATGQRLRPNWWLDLHNWLGGAALAFIAAHILSSWLDATSGVGVAQIFVPGTSPDGWGITWGVLAAYLLTAAVFTSWPRRLRKRPWWRVIHLGSVAATAMAYMHTYQTGSDLSRFVFQVGFVLTGGLASYALGVRLFSYIEKRAESSRRATAGFTADSELALMSHSDPAGQMDT